MKIRPFSILAFIIIFLSTFKIQAQDFIKLEGKILAADSKEPIPFASIGIPEKGIGNISNEAGAFELKIPVADKNAKVCISALGFKEFCLPVSSFKEQNHTVFLEPANLQLATVEIKAISAESLVKEAIRRIPENYADKPVKYTYYHRELSITNDKPSYIIESVDEAFQNHPKKDYQSRILKSRGISTSKENQEKMDGAWVQVNAIFSYTDVARSRPFLHPSKYKNYDYRFEKEDLIGKDTVFVIAFKPKLKSTGNEVAGLAGKLFMHHPSKAIIRLEYKDNKAALDKENNSLLIKAANKVEKGELLFTSDKEVFEYKKYGNRWYLYHVYREYSSQFTLIENPVPERHQGFAQLVVSGLQLENAVEIPEEQRAKKFANFYSKAPKDMNEDYWQQYNVILLPEAYQKLQKQ